MKRNLILIAGITIAVLVMMLLGNVITIGEKLGEVLKDRPSTILLPFSSKSKGLKE